jgi:hypothetical protein
LEQSRTHSKVDEIHTSENHSTSPAAAGQLPRAAMPDQDLRPFVAAANRFTA